MGFGPRGGLSIARRLLRAFKLPGVERERQAWLARKCTTALRKACFAKVCKSKSLRRVAFQLKIRQLFQPAASQPAQARGDLHEAQPSSNRRRSPQHTNRLSISQRSFRSDVQVRAVGGIIL